MARVFLRSVSWLTAVFTLEADRETERQRDRETDKQTDRQTERERDRDYQELLHNGGSSCMQKKLYIISNANHI